MISSNMSSNEVSIEKPRLTDAGKFWAIYLLSILCITMVLLL
jgi:hypothetical protein